jgi:predicted nucleic acid-binding protein
MPALFDSSIYISALRKGYEGTVTARNLVSGTPLWLSAVVLEELYAGVSGKGSAAIERLERDFHQAKRILVPNLGDWAQAGKVLARLAAKYGYENVGRGRLSNDALIAMSAARLGITVITANEKDFARLAEFRQFDWRLAVV